jgi:hypothetical protein
MQVQLILDSETSLLHSTGLRLLVARKKLSHESAFRTGYANGDCEGSMEGCFQFPGEWSTFKEHLLGRLIAFHHH